MGGKKHAAQAVCGFLVRFIERETVFLKFIPGDKAFQSQRFSVHFAELPEPKVGRHGGGEYKDCRAVIDMGFKNIQKWFGSHKGIVS
jgi:hypothetical protein